MQPDREILCAMCGKPNPTLIALGGWNVHEECLPVLKDEAGNVVEQPSEPREHQ